MHIIEPRQIIFTAVVVCLAFGSCQKDGSRSAEKFANFIVDARRTNLEFFWRDDAGKPFKTIQRLKDDLASRGRRLRFAMNGGMYENHNQPKGLFIQNQKTLVPLDRRNGDGNFYLQPNGVFYLTIDNQAFVAQTKNFKDDGRVKFATQSGPMLIVDGQINRVFDQNSKNLNIRNGVCVLPNGKIVFALSQQETNFYEFARYFQNLGCRDALYLDGFVSRMYLPEQNIEQLDGDFGVIIGVTE